MAYAPKVYLKRAVFSQHPDGVNWEVLCNICERPVRVALVHPDEALDVESHCPSCMAHESELKAWQIRIISSAIRRLDYEPEEQETVRKVAQAIADNLKNAHSRFEPHRFMINCGLESE